MAELLQIISSVDEHGATVRLVGELDISTGGPVELELERVTAQGYGVTIDLAGLRFIDSVGIGLLVRWRNRLGPAGALGIRGATGQVLEVFRLTAMLEHFGLEEPRDAR